MRNVIGLLVVLLMCAGLSSCSGNRPEKAFMGTWKGMYGEDPVEFSFMEKEIVVAQTLGKTMGGTWIIDPKGNARLTFEGEDGTKIIATAVNDGKIIAREEGESNAVVLEKSD